MRISRFGTNFKIVPAIVPTAGAVAAFTATEVNCTGYDRVCYVVIMGAAAAGATMSFKVTEAAATGMGGAADITNAASAGLTKAAHENKICTYDIPVNPAKLFQKCAGAVGTDTFANAAIAILYKKNNTSAVASYPVDTAYATEAVVV
jgi:hypothetical protein